MELSEIKIGAVPYINALPLCAKLDTPIVYNYPSILEQKLLDHRLNLALSPIYTYLDNPTLFGNFSCGVIQSQGAVLSVLIKLKDSLRDIREIKTINYTKQSRTSVNLVKVLLDHYYDHPHRQLTVVEENADATVMIGDDALQEIYADQKGIIDLGHVWQEWQGLPFVYATWISDHKLKPSVINTLKHAKNLGMDSINEFTNKFKEFDTEYALNYLTKHIHYEMTHDSLEGIQKFRDLLLESGLIKTKRTVYDSNV